MKKVHSILLRVILGGALILVLAPCGSCGENAIGQGLKCPKPSCCQIHPTCRHQVPKSCQHLMKGHEGVVYAKSLKPAVTVQAIRVSRFTLPAVGPNTRVFHRLLMIQSPPGSSLTLRI
ncbi:MAG TPA: hypothetical protein VJ873_06360 [bacterium]|nr:hypothetical protein [bacterium]